MSDRSRKRLCFALAFAGMLLAAVFSPLNTGRNHSVFFEASERSEDTSALPVNIALNGTINVNMCDPFEMTVLPGIGESTARLIADERTANGMFYYPEDLLAVKGIGQKKLSAILPDIDLSVPVKED